jgi:hypothetical protein
MMPRRPNYYVHAIRRTAARALNPPKDEHRPVAVSNEESEFDRSVNSIFGHLRVSPHRQYDIEVKHEFNTYAPGVVKPMSDPVNQCGPLLCEQVPVATGNDYESFMAAFNKRCNFLATDDVDDDVFNEACDLVRAMPDIFDVEWDENDMDRDRWAAKFDHHKQRRMADAYHNIPHASVSYLGTKDLSVKQEILLKRNDPSWAPRIIYAGNDEFNTVTGPASMVAMERIDSLFANGPLGEVEFMTAYKRDDVTLATFLSDDPELSYPAEGDYSANDREQRARVALLFDVVLSKVRMPSWYRDLLLAMDTFRAQSRAYGLRATISHQLPTGTTITTARNSAYNACMFSVSCRRQGNRGKAVILGDDLLAMMLHLMDKDEWIATVAKFKMKLKAAVPQFDCEATFLSKRIIASSDPPCMVPLLGKAIARFNARGIHCDAVSSSQYMAGKALSYAYEFRHVPFMRDFFLKRFELEDRSNVRLDDLTWSARTAGVTLDTICASIVDEPVTVSDDTFREWLMEAYDVGLTDLHSLCSDVLLSSEISLISHPAVHGLSRDWV